MPEFDKTWKLHPEGPLLGTRTIISPWTGGPTDAVVNIDSGKVIAAHGATCQPFDFIPPVSLRGEVYKGALNAVQPLAISSIRSSVGTTDDVLDGEIETGLAALINPNPTGCNVCGEPTHMGCCNPNRPADALKARGHYEEMEVFALTDSHVAQLERAIRAEGFNILVDPETNELKLEKALSPYDDPCGVAGERVSEDGRGKVVRELTFGRWFPYGGAS